MSFLETSSKQSLMMLWVGHIIYLVLGAGFFFFQHKQAAAFSFAGGWFFSVANFELIKRLGLLLLPLYIGKKESLSPTFYILVLLKFAFLGVVLTVLSKIPNLEMIPFFVGTLSVLFSAIILAVQYGFRSEAESN